MTAAAAASPEMKVKSISSDTGVSLAPLGPEHVTDTYVGWLNDPAVIRFTEIRSGETLESVRTYVAATNKAPNTGIWRILVDGDSHVGNIRLSNIRWVHRRAEVAMLIGSRAHWGRGIGATAIGLLSAHAFEKLTLHKLTAGILEPNVRSRRAFEKAGFNCEAVLRRHALTDGAYCDVLLMTRFARSETNGK